MAVRLNQAQLAAARAALVRNQDGKCAICQEPFTRSQQPKVDHDHKTGFLRGALCNNCNGIEGKISNLANRAKRKGTVLMFLVSLCKYLHHHRVPRTKYQYPAHKTADEKRLLKNKRNRMGRKGLKANGHKKVAKRPRKPTNGKRGNTSG